MVHSLASGHHWKVRKVTEKKRKKKGCPCSPAVNNYLLGRTENHILKAGRDLSSCSCWKVNLSKSSILRIDDLYMLVFRL